MDINAIKKKLSQLQSSTTGKSDKIWKPEPGKTQLRIVPYQFNKETPFIELLFHYEFNKKSYLSPASFGQKDPIVEFADQLKSTGDRDEWKMGKKLEPKMRIFAPVIIRGKESEGVKFWGFGKQLYQEILSFIADDDYGDITDLKHGRDITVEFQTAEDAGNSFGKTSVRVKPNATPATDDKQVLDKILNGQTDITTIHNAPTYDELKDILKKWFESADGEAPSEPAPAEKPAPKASGKSGVITPNKNADVAKAFDSLFDEK